MLKQKLRISVFSQTASTDYIYYTLFLRNKTFFLNTHIKKTQNKKQKEKTKTQKKTKKQNKKKKTKTII